MKCDAEGNLFVTHSSLGCICVVSPAGVPLAKIVTNDAKSDNMTNLVFGSTDKDRKRIYIVESRKGKISTVDWHCEGVLPIRPKE